MIVEFIIPTYNRKYPLGSILASLIAQTNGDWGAHVVIDDPEQTIADDVLEIFNDNRIKKTHLDKRYKDWGNTPREYGKQQSNANYVIMTGDDNYYTPNLVKELKLAAKDNPGMIYWDMVHSHYKYSYFKCTPVINCIDIGAFATRTDLAKEIVLTTTFAADGEFVRDFIKKFPLESLVKIDKVLFVHN